MLKLKLDKGFSQLFTSGGRAFVLGGIILLGLLLILLGGIGGREAEPDANEKASESRLAEMCSLMDGVGECRVMMTYHPEDEDRVYAVLVLCEGAESPPVREKITSLISSLYGIGSHRVEIRRLKSTVN